MTKSVKIILLLLVLGIPCYFMADYIENLYNTWSTTLTDMVTQVIDQTVAIVADILDKKRN